MPRLLLALAIIPYCALHAVETRIEFTHPGGALNAGASTNIMTHQGVTYVAAMNGTTLEVHSLMDGVVHESAVVRTNIQNNQFHVMPSLAVDRDGYIHVSADMHNQSWVYYISNRAESLTDGFTQYLPGHPRCPPGKVITYPEFFKDRNGELYLAFRHFISVLPPAPYSFQPGNPAGGLARYDAASRTWAWIGGRGAPGYPGGAGDEDPALFWAPSGAYGGWYQQPRVRLFFDATNRMHAIATLATTQSDRAWNGMTHLVYAYSDDGGSTFRKADGAAIPSLPLTVDNATVIVDRAAQCDMEAGGVIGAFSPAQPVVTVRYNGAAYILKWNGTAWTPLSPPGTGLGVVTHPDGSAIILRPFFGIYRSTDGGATWTSIPHGLAYKSSSDHIDLEHYYRTWNVRWSTVGQTDYKLSVYHMLTGTTPQAAQIKVTSGIHTEAGGASRLELVLTADPGNWSYFLRASGDLRAWKQASLLFDGSAWSSNNPAVFTVAEAVFQPLDGTWSVTCTDATAVAPGSPRFMRVGAGANP